MKLLNVLRKESMRTHSRAQSKRDAIDQVVEAAKSCDVLMHVSAEDILDGLLKREELGSTGFGGGIAIPHCRLPNVNEFVVGMMTFSDGVDFDALDGKPVSLLVFIVAPDSQSDAHIRLLSGISQVLSIPGAVDEMTAESSTEGLYESFLRHVRDEVQADQQDQRSLFHVFVQDEDFFRDILQIFSGMQTSTAVVMDTQNAAAYLSKLPLFSAFWTDNPRDFNRLIVAVVSRNMVNETIRRIERITGPLKERTGIMVTVQDLFYAAGRIEP
jgi:PTS system nitrogen regulatory IIA component